MMQTDIKVGTIGSTGTIFNDRTRLRGMLIIPGSSAGSIVVRDGGSSGTVLFTIATLANGTPFSVVIPPEGILCYTNIYATISNVTGSIFYG